MPITLSNYDICLATAPDCTQALLCNEPMPFASIQQQVTKPWPIALLNNIRAFLADLPITENEPIFWLLPNLAYDEQQLDILKTGLNEIAPNQPLRNSLVHPVNVFFPYGESALHLALAHALPSKETIWLISVDEQQVPKQDSMVTVGYALAAAKLESGPTGLDVIYCHSEPSYDIRQHNPFSTLLQQAAEACKGIISRIYCPAIGDTAWSQAWLEGYLGLNGKVVDKPQLILPEYYHGKLGATWGLY